MTEAERFNMRATFVWWAILFAGSMGLMIRTASHKAIVISDVTYGQESIASSIPNAQDKTLRLEGAAGYTNVFMVPLAKGVKAENVAVENCYIDGELHIFLKDAEDDFYNVRSVEGDISHIMTAAYEPQSEGVLLKLQMDGVYEYKSSMENEVLKVEMFAPHELYRMIVVIDPAGGGQKLGASAVGVNEKSVALEVGRAVQRQWTGSEVGIYYTRSEDVEVLDEQRVALADAVGADLYVRLAVGTDENSQSYGILGCYNEQYFIPEFGNVQLADILVRNVTISCGNKAIGLQAAEEDSVLQTLRIPAAEIQLGLLSNEKERGLLAQDGYYEKLAEGIVKAIEEVYSTYYE